MTKPNLVISVDDAGVISMKAESTFKTTEIKFKLNEEFDETTVDGRKTKVGKFLSLCKLFFFHFNLTAPLTTQHDFQTVFTVENGKLMQRQMWDGKETTLEREIQDGKLTAVSKLNEHFQKHLSCI